MILRCRRRLSPFHLQPLCRLPSLILTLERRSPIARLPNTLPSAWAPRHQLRPICPSPDHTSLHLRLLLLGCALSLPRHSAVLRTVSRQKDRSPRDQRRRLLTQALSASRSAACPAHHTHCALLGMGRLRPSASRSRSPFLPRRHRVRLQSRRMTSLITSQRTRTKLTITSQAKGRGLLAADTRQIWRPASCDDCIPPNV